MRTSPTPPGSELDRRALSRRFQSDPWCGGRFSRYQRSPRSLPPLLPPLLPSLSASADSSEVVSGSTSPKTSAILRRRARSSELDAGSVTVSILLGSRSSSAFPLVFIQVVFIQGLHPGSSCVGSSARSRLTTRWLPPAGQSVGTATRAARIIWSEIVVPPWVTWNAPTRSRCRSPLYGGRTRRVEHRCPPHMVRRCANPGGNR